MAEYCDRRDLYEFGLPRGSVPNPARRVVTVATAQDWLELEGHGLSEGDSVTFRAESGGSVMAPIVAGVVYYARPVDENHFAVSATIGGSTIDLTSTGSRVLVVTPLPIASAIQYASALIDDMIPASVLPLAEPYPPIIRMTCAEIAAAKLGYYSGGVSKSITLMFDDAKARLAKWAKGAPIRGENAPKPADLACGVGVPFADSRGWYRYGGTV